MSNTIQMRKCIVDGCSSTTQTGSMCRWPRGRDLAQVWMDLLRSRSSKLRLSLERRHRVGSNVYVCKLHFEEKFIKNDKRVTSSWPTLFTDLEISTGKPTCPITVLVPTEGDHSYSVNADLVNHKRKWTESDVEIALNVKNLCHDHSYGMNLNKTMKLTLSKQVANQEAPRLSNGDESEYPFDDDIFEDISEPVPQAEPTITTQEEEELDRFILEILGRDPTVVVEYGKSIHKELARRLEHVTTSGLTRETRKELTEKYLIPVNCTKIGAPKLSAEIKAAVSEFVTKRDKGIEMRQKQLASAIAGLAGIMNKELESKEKDSERLKQLMDVCRILCDFQHAESVTRRNFAILSIKKELKDHLVNSKIDEYLFG